MKKKHFNLKQIFLLIFLYISTLAHSQIGIGTTTPDPSSILDINSITSGLLIPRLTTSQRNAITAPANGLQIYNTDNNTFDIYSDGWKSFAYSRNTNLVYVYSLADLPTPVAGQIVLDGTKMYVFSGMVDISPNYITLNDAGLRGTDPQKDGVLSSVSGAVLRSVDTSIFMENFTVIPFSSSTTAYNFSDSTGTKFCNVFSGCSVVEIIPTLGVGQVSGFNAVTFIQNYWKATDGLKITGNIGKFTSSFCFITGISNGSGLEFLAGLTADDVDLSNNYFIYTGQNGITISGSANVDRGILTSNMFRGVTNPLNGAINSYSPGWSMRQNTNIADSRAFSFIYFNNNPTSTTLTTVGTFYKIEGTTSIVNEKRFTATNNRITFNDKVPITGKISVVIGAKSPAANCDFSIGIAKNGVMIAAPIASMAAAANNQSFQITLNTEVDLTTNDYIEVFIKKNNSNTSSIIVDEMQFRVTQ